MKDLKSLLGAVCATSLMVGAANAGVLDIQVTNTNTGAPNQMDMNAVAGPAGTLNQDNPAEITTEEPLMYTLHRDTSGVKPLKTHVEIEAYDIEGLPTFSGDEIYLVTIDLLGSADPVFKTDISQAAIVRPGSDDEFSEAAEGFPAGQIIKTGTKKTQFFLTPAEVSETAIGFNLPVQLQACGDFDVRISFTTFVGPFQNTRVVNTADKADRVASCVGPAFEAAAITPDDLLVDIGPVTDPFELFLVADGASQKGYDTVNMLEFGLVTLDITNHVVSAKVKNDANGGDSVERLTDVTDIDTYTLQYTFESLDGIDSIEMVGCGELATLDGNTATWELDATDVEACFGIGAISGDDGDSQSGEVVLKIMSSEDAPIQTQKVELTEHSIEFVDDMFGTDDSMFLPEFELQPTTPDAFRIVRNGLNFGAFDWVTQPGKKVRSVFRVTGIPDVPGYTEGILFIENSQFGIDGYCEFDLADLGIFNGELVINPDKFDSIVTSPSCYKEDGGTGSLGGFGRADVTFSLFIPSPDGDKVDMDRLLWSPGDIFADYGDNGNDSNSIKARSCDPGRFGSHVVNHLSGDQADILVDLCNSDLLPFN